MFKTGVFLLLCVLLLTQPLYAQFAAVTPLEPLEVTTNTSDKPQSKVWNYDGKWWTVLTNTEGTFLWRLNGNRWVKALRLSTSSYGKADCKVVGNVVHILVFRGNNVSYLYSVEYSAAAGTYKVWSNRSTRVTLSLGSGIETASIDIDGTGKMWLAYDVAGGTGTHEIQVRWSDAPYSSWSMPVTLESGVTKDDIAAVIALPGKIAVMWSNQYTKRFGFRTHIDGHCPANWSADESPASQSALNIRAGFADDHLNMALGSDSTLYCAVKTSYDTPGFTKLGLLVRRPNGSWDNVYDVSTQEGTRAIVLLNEVVGKLKVVYTDTESGGNILCRESSLDSIAFSAPMMLLEGVYNFATSSKSNYTNELVILASNTTHAVGVMAVETVSDTGKVTGESEGVILGAIQDDVAKNINSQLKLYPNPFSNTFNLSFVLPQGGEYILSLYNSRGEQVRHLVVKNSAQAGQENQLTIDGTGLPEGLYILKLQTTTGTQTMRVMCNP